MKLVRSVMGEANSFSDEISTSTAHGPSQDAETVSVYLGHTRRTHYRLEMTLAQAKDLSFRLQREIARRKHQEGEQSSFP